jgi:hypothetical protein
MDEREMPKILRNFLENVAARNGIAVPATGS